MHLGLPSTPAGRLRLTASRVVHCARVGTTAAATACALGLALCVAHPLSTGSETRSPVDDLSARIAELRVQVRYDEAAAEADRLLALIRSQPSVRSQEIEDAEWLLESLQHASTLPPRTQRLLARADSLEQHLRVTVAYNQAGGGALAETWLRLVEDALGPRRPEIYRAHTVVGGYHYFDGNYRASEHHFREALRLAREDLGGEHPRIAGYLSDLAIPVLLQGHFTEAEVLLREALERLSRLRGNASALEAMNNLAAVLERQGDDLGAESLARATIEGARVFSLQRFGHANPNIGHLNRLARILRREGELDQAEAEVRRAIEVNTTCGYAEISFDLAISYLVLGNILADRGDLEAALAAHERSLDICSRVKGEDHADVAHHMMALAETHLKRRESDDAERLLRRALAINRRSLGPVHFQTCENLVLLGRTLETPSTLPEAEAVLTEASAVFDAVRLRGTLERRATLPLASPGTDLALVRLAAGRSADAWPAAEHALARTLADLLLEADQRSLSPSDAARQDSLARVLTDLERAVEALSPPPSSHAVAAGGPHGEGVPTESTIRLRLLRAQADWVSLQSQLARRYGIAEADQYPLERIQATLTANAALVGWIDPPQYSTLPDRWGYVIRASGPPRWVRLPAANDASAELRATLSEAASWPLRVPSSADVIRCARGLWDQYLAPLDSHLAGIESLYVIASGSTLGVPIEAALDPEAHWAADRFAISYVPSATVHAWLRERESGDPPAKGSGGAALLVGDPPFAREDSLRSGERLIAEMSRKKSIPVETVWRSAIAGNAQALDELPPLPWSRDEVLRLEHSLPGSTVLIGSDACEQALADLAAGGRLTRFRFLHFATHAIVDDRAPEGSALVLSRVDLPDPVRAAIAGERVYDGLLRAVEVTREWQLDADLVTLSGCRTGLGKAAPGEGYLGLAHAFLQVGARSLLVSLWEVDDRASALFMDRFYENLTGSYAGQRGGRQRVPLGKAEALREAKRWLRDLRDADGTHPYAHPVYWSPFVLIGDPD